MKPLNIFAGLLGVLFLITLGAELSLAQVDDYTCGTTPALDQPGTLPSAMVGTITRGGREITNQGTLRVLVVYVRFADDVLNTADWPNYAVLPSWAQTIVDPTVPPPGGTYTAKNLSDFFDRTSGGDGSGNLGLLRVVGDVYYVTTDSARSFYGNNNDGAVNQHVWSKLDNPKGSYRINFALYDNWKFIKNGEYYNHENVPDGKVDYIFMMWRQQSTYTNGSSWLGIKTVWTSFTTNDGVTIQSTAGSTQYYNRDRGPFDAFDTRKARTIYVPAHEFTHYLFGGGHFDDAGGNIGNILFFALMSANTNGNMCAYERYRAGWLNPDVMQQNESNRILQDTHVKNKAIMFPIRTDASNNIVEHFLVENFHSQNDYAGANPFLRRQIFNHYLQKGLLVYHIENENLNIPPSSNLDIDCADGLWQWAVIQGASTPSDRTDDLIGHGAPTYHTGFDERDQITITVGTVTWTDYFALRAADNGCGTGNPCNAPCTPTQCNHGWRYTKSSWLGDNEDFFRENENDVISSFSNPSTYRADGVTNSNTGFEIVGYNSTLKEYTLKIAVNASGVLDLKPSKPQDLKISVQSQGGDNHPKLDWAAMQEPDVITGGKLFIHRRTKIGTGNWGNWILRDSVAGTVSQYVDNQINTAGGGPDSLQYRIQARDSQNKLSVFSDVASIRWFQQGNKIAVGGVETEKPTTFGLDQNYPNPFNPSTIMKYQLAEDGIATLKVFDILGREVASLVDAFQPAGYYTATFNADQLASGVYFIRFTVADEMRRTMYTNMSKLLLVR
jgi:M6 family metalloprotease-like protein